MQKWRQPVKSTRLLFYVDVDTHGLAWLTNSHIPPTYTLAHSNTQAPSFKEIHRTFTEEGASGVIMST